MAMRQKQFAGALAGAALTLAVLAVVLTSAPVGLVELEQEPAVVRRWTSGVSAPAMRTELEYFANLGYTNAQNCDGARPESQQSPVAIDEGEDGVGNVLEEHLPPFGWVGLTGGGLFRMKTPGTRADTGEPGVELFVKGNKFDMSEVNVHTKYGGNHYKLDHFLLKTPAEHTVNGVTYDMEQQFVHYPQDGGPFKQLIVSVLYKENPLNSPDYIEKLYNAVPCMGEGKHCQGAFSFAEMARTILYQQSMASKFGQMTYQFDPMDVCKLPPCVFGGNIGDSHISAWVKPHTRPNFRSYFKYEGSETMPPCEEGVQWLVMKNPLPVASDHLKEFQLVIGDIARPVQPLNGRMITESVSRFWWT